MPKVGYQDGLKAAYNRIKKLDPAGCNPNYNPDDVNAIPVDQLKAWDKVHRTLKIIKEDHDAAIPSNGGGGNGEPPPPDDPKLLFFPRTFNKEGGSDARFCVSTSSPAYSHTDDRGIHDKGGGVYRSDGLCDGGRDPDFIARKENGEPLRGAKSMDSFGPCDLYDGLTEWPPDSYKR
jgi:hypothetical protein